MDYATQMDAARQGKITPEMKAVAASEQEDTCSMCGNFCAVKNMNRILEGEIVSIFDE